MFGYVTAQDIEELQSHRRPAGLSWGDERDESLVSIRFLLRHTTGKHHLFFFIFFIL